MCACVFATFLSMHNATYSNHSGPRYGSSLVYVQSLESVFLYGGRNNMIDQKQKGFFNDMYVYRVYSNEWMECTCINSEQYRN